jgi:preprotein translocase subunit Sec61beta
MSFLRFCVGPQSSFVSASLLRFFDRPTVFSVASMLLDPDLILVDSIEVGIELEAGAVAISSRRSRCRGNWHGGLIDRAPAFSSDQIIVPWMLACFKIRTGCRYLRTERSGDRRYLVLDFGHLSPFPHRTLDNSVHHLRKTNQQYWSKRLDAHYAQRLWQKSRQSSLLSVR